MATLALSWLLASVTAEASPAFRKKITINPGQVTGGPLADFPLLSNTTDPALRTVANGGSVTNPNGWDIIFATTPTCADSTTCGGNKLDHEIESYDAVAGRLIAWVRLPSINDGKVFYIHYSDTGVAASTENRTAVWNRSYKALWHLRESGLSVDEAAQLYHKALLQELLSGGHQRLGDAILAAQHDHASTGALPELLSIYNLLGDPALRLR